MVCVGRGCGGVGGLYRPIRIRTHTHMYIIHGMSTMSFTWRRTYPERRMISMRSWRGPGMVSTKLAVQMKST